MCYDFNNYLVRINLVSGRVLDTKFSIMSVCTYTQWSVHTAIIDRVLEFTLECTILENYIARCTQLYRSVYTAVDLYVRTAVHMLCVHTHL